MSAPVQEHGFPWAWSAAAGLVVAGLGLVVVRRQRGSGWGLQYLKDGLNDRYRGEGSMLAVVGLLWDVME